MPAQLYLSLLLTLAPVPVSDSTSALRLPWHELGLLAPILIFVLVGATLQGSIGVGQGLLAAPLIALVDTAYLPGPLLASTTLLVILMVIRDHRAIDLRGVGWAIAGRVPGTLVGALAVAALSGAWLEVVLGSLILLCVISSVVRWHPRATPRLLIAAGFVSGISGTATAVGGPPVALVLQHERPDRLRATLSGYFLCGTTMSIVILSAVGRFGKQEALFTAALAPAVILGFLLSSLIASRLDGRLARPAILAVSGAASIVLIVRGVSAISAEVLASGLG